MYGVARWLVALALAYVASCSSAQPKPAQTKPAQTTAAPATRARYAAIERGSYDRKLLFLLSHGWRVSREVESPPMSLRTTAEVELDKHGTFVGYRLAVSSGNPLFDDSVSDHLQALIDSGAHAEHGPPYIVDHVFGEAITVRFTGPPTPDPSLL